MATPHAVVPAIAFLARQIDTDFTGRVVDPTQFGKSLALTHTRLATVCPRA
jgi:hypothetical protein